MGPPTNQLTLSTNSTLFIYVLKLLKPSLLLSLQKITCIFHLGIENRTEMEGKMLQSFVITDTLGITRFTKYNENLLSFCKFIVNYSTFSCRVIAHPFAFAKKMCTYRTT